MSVLYCPADELQEIRERFRWYLKQGDITLKPIPELDLPKDRPWILYHDYNGRPVGINTWEPTPYVIESDFSKITYTGEFEVLADISQHGHFVIKHVMPSRDLSEDEQEWAKQKFADLLVEAQTDRLEQIERAKEIMGGDLD